MSSPQVTAPVDPLLAHGNRRSPRRGAEPAIFDAQGRVLLRFREIEELSRSCRIDLAAGEIVAIQIGNHPHWPALLLACLRRGVVVLPLEQTVSVQERTAALRTCRAAGLLTSAEGAVERLRDRGRDRLAGPRAVAAQAHLRHHRGAARDSVSERAAASRMRSRFATRWESATRDLNFAVIPLSHSYGFSNLVTPLLVRGVPMAVSADRMPRAVLEDLARTEATVFPGMPLFYQAFCEMPVAPPLPHLRLCISAGAPLPQQVALGFRAKFGRAIHSFYGASECGGICYDRVAKEPRQGFVGPAMRGVAISPIEPSASATQIEVRSAAVGDGYFPEPNSRRNWERRFSAR